jgi:hypothetical protein
VNDIDTRKDGDGVSICPGPNLAYFTKKVKLKEMIDHIYNRANLIERKDRPHMFIKELNLYYDYLKEQVSEIKNPIPKQVKSLEGFKKNLLSGVDYYKGLSQKFSDKYNDMKNQVSKDLEKLEGEIKSILIKTES